MAHSLPVESSSAPLGKPVRAGLMRRHAIKLVASVLITCGVVYTVHKGGLKFIPEGTDFQSVRWWTLPLYWVSLFAMTWFRSTRWRYLLRSIAEVPRKRLLAVSAIGFAAILIFPFRIGEIVRPYLIRTRPSDRREGERVITMTAATSSVVAERIIDGLYLSLVLAVALLFVPTVHPLPDRVVGIPVTVAQVRMSGYAMLGLFGALFGTVAVFYFARSWAHRATLIIVGKVSRALAEKLAHTFEKFADGLHIFGRGRDAFGFFVETTAYWSMNAAGMWLLAWGSGVVHVDGTAGTFGEACALMGMLGCAILIPGPPGMLGIFQAGIYSGMTMYYPTQVVIGSGAAYVFLMYASQVVFQLAMGAWGLIAEGSGGGLRGGLGKLEDAEQGIVAAPADAA
ncbi:MAG: flippase-like domain-containing protein [Myxococcota bacterium]|nr:flippase-like domain-containing protein [Myxococcota bacterium]